MNHIVTRLAPYILSLVIAILSFLTGSVTDVGQAVQIALDKEKAIVQAAEIMDATPPAEIEEALKEDAK